MWRGLYLYIVSIKSFLPCWFSSCLLSSLFVLLACNWRGRENQPRAVFTSWAKPCIYLFQPINKLNLYSSIMYSLSLYLLTLHLLVLYLFGIYFVFTSFSGNLKRLPPSTTSSWEPISCYNTSPVKPEASSHGLNISGSNPCFILISGCLL